MTETGSTEGRKLDEPARRWPRWKSVLLISSLALNLLIFGLVTAVGIRHGFRPPHGASQATVVSFARTLPGERKREIWSSVKTERRALRPYWRDLRRARAEVRDALTAEPFDITRYRMAHDKLLDAEVKVRKAAHTLYELVATRLTTEERRAFAHWQKKSERPWRRRAQQRQGDRDADEAADDEPQGSSTAKPTEPSTRP